MTYKRLLLGSMWHIWKSCMRYQSKDLLTWPPSPSLVAELACILTMTKPLVKPHAQWDVNQAITLLSFHHCASPFQPTRGWGPRELFNIHQVMHILPEDCLLLSELLVLAVLAAPWVVAHPPNHGVGLPRWQHCWMHTGRVVVQENWKWNQKQKFQHNGVVQIHGPQITPYRSSAYAKRISLLHEESISQCYIICGLARLLSLAKLCCCCQHRRLFNPNQWTIQDFLDFPFPLPSPTPQEIAEILSLPISPKINPCVLNSRPQHPVPSESCWSSARTNSLVRAHCPSHCDLVCPSFLPGLSEVVQVACFASLSHLAFLRLCRWQCNQMWLALGVYSPIVCFWPHVKQRCGRSPLGIAEYLQVQDLCLANPYLWQEFDNADQATCSLIDIRIYGVCSAFCILKRQPKHWASRASSPSRRWGDSHGKPGASNGWRTRAKQRAILHNGGVLCLQYVHLPFTSDHFQVKVHLLNALSRKWRWTTLSSGFWSPAHTFVEAGMHMQSLWVAWDSVIKDPLKVYQNANQECEFQCHEVTQTPGWVTLASR